MRFKIAYFKIKKRNQELINNFTHQRETLTEWPIWLPLMLQLVYLVDLLLIIDRYIIDSTNKFLFKEGAISKLCFMCYILHQYASAKESGLCVEYLGAS